MFGGDKGDRTPDLLIANQALSQLSYIPITEMIINQSPSQCKRFFVLLAAPAPHRLPGGSGLASAQCGSSILDDPHVYFRIFAFPHCDLTAAQCGSSISTIHTCTFAFLHFHTVTRSPHSVDLHFLTIHTCGFSFLHFHTVTRSPRSVDLHFLAIHTCDFSFLHFHTVA